MMAIGVGGLSGAVEFELLDVPLIRGSIALVFGKGLVIVYRNIFATNFKLIESLLERCLSLLKFGVRCLAFWFSPGFYLRYDLPNLSLELISVDRFTDHSFRDTGGDRGDQPAEQKEADGAEDADFIDLHWNGDRYYYEKDERAEEGKPKQFQLRVCCSEKDGHENQGDGEYESADELSEESQRRAADGRVPFCDNEAGQPVGQHRDSNRDSEQDKRRFQSKAGVGHQLVRIDRGSQDGGGVDLHQCAG